MSLSLSLNTALTGLNVNQQALSVLSQNIANANTAGYSRQIVNQQAITLNGTGAGVRMEDVTRRVDDYLNNAIKSQNSSVGMTGVLNDYAARIQIMLGQPGSSNSIDSYVNLFFNNVRSLAQTPEDTTLQRTAVNSAITLAGQIQGLAESLQGLQYQADQDIYNGVTQLNNDLESLHTVNNSIVTARSLGRGTADLEDQRDTLIKRISEQLSVSTYTRENGAVHLVTTSGMTLLDENLYRVEYTPVVSSVAFSNGGSLSPLTIQRLDVSGNPAGAPQELVTGGQQGTITSFLGSGKLQGLIQMRDTQIPNIVNELDMLAATLVDKFNAIHNMGTGYPGANSYTGTRAVNAGDYSLWNGSVSIAALGPDGQPLASPYPNESGVMPLNIDLSNMASSNGFGNPTTQDIINEINQYYGVPQPKVEVGNLNNIRLVSDSKSIPGNPASLSFDFDLSNISGLPANFFVTDVDVVDNLGVSTGAVTPNVPTVALDDGAPNDTYITTAGSNVVTINTSGTNNGLVEGQTIFLSDPGVTVDGIPASELGGYFTITNVTATSFEIEVATPAAAGAATSVAGQTALPPYTETDPGTNTRTLKDGFFTADLTGNSASPYYTINVSVGVDDGQGNIETAVISYRINNGQANILNNRYSVVTATGQAEIVMPTSNQPILTAMLVDEDGKELPKSGRTYTTQQNGFLKLVANNSSAVVAIDSKDSSQQGKPNDNPPQAGTGRGFSYYFELNNFFESNKPTTTGDTVKGSAANMQVEQRIKNTPGLMALGSLVQVTQPADPDADPLYLYQRNIGDNSIIQRLSDLGLGSTLFANAGGLAQTTQTFAAYAAQIIGAASTDAVTAKTDATNAQGLLDGFTQRSSSISGVNLDTELANTVIYQNSYAASARVITVTSELFDTLLSIGR
jgi:flagellar hook-associated protein FlgK